MKMELDAFELQKRKVDLADIGGSVVDATSLSCGGHLIFNALEFADYSDEGFQIHICEHCFNQGCERGGWASLRKVANKAILVPAIQLMRGGDRDPAEYAPPHFMTQGIFPALREPQYLELSQLIAGLPQWNSIIDLSSREALAMHQLAAPGQILGEAGSAAKLKTDALVAVTEGELDAEVQTLRNLLNRIEDDAGNGFCVNPDRVVEFHLDLPDFPAWPALSYAENKPFLNLAEFADT